MDSFYMEYYTQELVIEFTSQQLAKQAHCEILPLYAGKEWAISSRWDDNLLTDMKMREVLEQHGYRGTFYLNSSQGHFYYGKDYGHFKEAGEEYASLGKRLLAGGNSIGGHSLLHPFLTRMNRNRIFEEVMGIRADRESDTDSPINSYAFAFCDFNNAVEGDAVQRDIGEALRRAGYYHIANNWFNREIDDNFQESALLPGDGAAIDKEFSEFLRANRLGEIKNISFCMHVWYETPAAWDKFERQLEKYGGKREWWYCNQNEYAAYRYQFHNASLESKVSGKQLKLKIRRPELLDLNDAVPLSLRLRGIKPGEVVKITSKAGAGIEALPNQGGDYAFNLAHDAGKGLPQSISINGGGAGPEEQGVSVQLSATGGTLEAVLKNQEELPLENVRLSYRLPLAYQPGVVRKRLAGIKSGGQVTDKLKLKPPRDDGKYTAGENYYQLQVDFRQGEEWRRVYASCSLKGRAPGASYPQGNFAKHGPLTAAVAVRLAAEGGPQQWQYTPGDMEQRLDVEIIVAGGEQRTKEAAHYLLKSVLLVKKSCQAKMIYDQENIQAVYLNGKRVSGKLLELAKGENQLLLHFSTLKGNKFSGANYGAYLRLADAKSGKRLKQVTYRWP